MSSDRYYIQVVEICSIGVKANAAKIRYKQWERSLKIQLATAIIGLNSYQGTDSPLLKQNTAHLFASLELGH